jgi:methyl-accepting chemotaxis protein
MAENPLELLAKSQQAAFKLATDTLRTVRDTAVSGVTAPDELLKQVAELSTAVAGLAGSITGVAGATAQPLQNFIVRQRELAETVAKFAEAQAELSGIVAELAERQSEIVAALESVTAPVFTLVGTQPTEPSRGRKKK